MSAPAPPTPPSSALRSGRFARNRHRLFLALGGALVLLLLGSSHWQATASLRALGALQRQAERVEHLDSLLIQLMDAENAVRGYLLTGNRAHLEPHARSRATANGTLEAIRSDLEANPDNEDALADLSGLVAIKLRSLDQAAERGFAGEETRIQGKRYTDRIRDRILGLKAQLAAEGELSFQRSTVHVERTRWVVGTLAAGALALMAVLFLAIERQFKLREQIADLLHSENQRLDALVQERTAELSDLASYLTNAREVEKARLARELHDELGALLTAARMETESIARQLNAGNFDQCRERLARLQGHIDGGIAMKRRIIDDLRPPLLEMLGLVSALRTLAEEFAHDAGESLSLELPADDVEVAPEPALALFRIAQEALTNIRKHARARRVILALRVAADALELEIEDDGQGFQAGPMQRGHHGLAGMKHRVQMCSGRFTVASRPGAGTRIAVRLPRTAAAGTVEIL
ncbi:CHASE3 domain-containing protein [Propionivibrio sp.]|uniref:CHASE3 domain-containing protein n=1 Tax=Propionivibrio sp. TaxID=2212460 RepID=UPI0039E2290A